MLGGNTIVFFKFLTRHHDALAVAVRDHDFVVGGFFTFGENVADASVGGGF